MSETRRVIEPQPEFMVIATLLAEVIGHKCGCDICQVNKQNAFGAFVWLVSKTTNVPIHVVDEKNGMKGMSMDMDRDHYEPPARFVQAVLQNAAQEKGLSDEGRAWLQGFLERLNGGES